MTTNVLSTTLSTALMATLNRQIKRRLSSKVGQNVDVLIVGGGIMGSSAAYWIKKEAGKKLNVCVIEKDMTFRQSSTALSVGGVRQQFSNPENIQMSLFGAKFVEEIGKHLHVDGFPIPDVNFTPNGYLVMASKECAGILERNAELQKKLGAKNVLLNPKKLSETFPWLNVDGIELGCLGIENEGWFDPWLLLSALKRKAQYLGANYESGEVVNINTVETGDLHKVNKAQVKIMTGEIVDFETDNLVITAGAYSGRIAAMAGIGSGKNDLSVPLPIEPRPEGSVGSFICGRSPAEEDEPSVEHLDVEDEFFEQQIWPVLATRVPSFESLKVHCSWAGFYEYNTVDQNAVIGRHPSFSNLFISAGFSGHGIQHGPAAGHAIKELILDGGYKTLDLTRLGFERFIRSETMLEKNIY